MRGRSRSLTLAGVAALLGGLPVAAVAAPLAVIDPGHGGDRTGAQTAEGVTEKVIVLSVSRYAKAALERAGIRVSMTRDGDQNLSLRARTETANRLDAAVFVSVHANSAPVETRRGCETYVLSAQASDDAAAALVHLENAADEETAGRFVNVEEFGGGVADRIARGGSGDVDFILADLTRAATHRRSASLAKRLQTSLARVPVLAPSRGLRQAPFRVLRGARMPAALVEIGYLTHPRQGLALASKRTQRAAGEAIARGIIAFLGRGSRDAP